MKLLSLFLSVTISLFIISCSNQNASDPVSPESTALSKTGFALEKGGLAPFMFDGGGLLAVLDLSEAQKAQIQEIIQSQHEQFKSLRRSFDGRPSREEIQAKRQEFHEKIRNQIYAVLTPQQQTKLDELKAQLQNGQVPEAFIDKRIEALNAKLNLTEEQINRIKGLDTWNKLLQVKSGGDNPKEFRQQRREIFKEHEEKMLNILTPEQQTLFREMRAQQRGKIMQGLNARFENRSQKHVERLSTALDLNEKQQRQLTEIFVNMRSNVKGELNGNGTNREERRQAMREKMRGIDEQIREILNSKQLEKYNELKLAWQEDRKSAL